MAALSRSPVSPSESAAAFALLSLVVHGTLVLLVPDAHSLTRELESFEVTLGPAPGGALAEGATNVPEVVHTGPPAPALPGGAEASHNVDAARTGAGGERTGAIDVVFLLPEDAPVTQTDAPMNAAELSQTSRIETGDERVTFEDRRATPNPDDDAFVASGPGEHAERRPVSALDPAPGARRAPEPGTAGETRPLVDASVGATAERSVASTEGSAGAARSSPGVGILGGAGRRSDDAARVATGRPSVDLGTASTTADERGRTRDDTDSELLAAHGLESLAETTRRAGTEAGDGAGGLADPRGAPGTSGASGERGGRALALGPGDGEFDALDTSDARYRRWMLDQRRRIEDVLDFPRARMLSMDQGTAVLRVVVRRDGSIVGTPRVVRTSGFSDLDAAALAALTDVLPFSPWPDDLWPERERATISVPIAFSNPMTH